MQDPVADRAQYQRYAKKHKVRPIFRQLTNAMLHKQPQDPLQFIAEWANEKSIRIDALTRGLQVEPESKEINGLTLTRCQAYVDKHGVRLLMRALMTEILKKQPQDPLLFIAEWATKRFEDEVLPAQQTVKVEHTAPLFATSVVHICAVRKIQSAYRGALAARKIQSAYRGASVRFDHRQVKVDALNKAGQMAPMPGTKAGESGYYQVRFPSFLVLVGEMNSLVPQIYSKQIR